MMGFIGMALTMGMMEDNPYEITERGRVGKDNAPKPRHKESKEFKDQDGIVGLIKDYVLIKSGQSKKGKTKQNRIVSKVDAMIEKGYLTQTDLNLD